LNLTEEFDIAEEEGTVFPDRSAQAAAKLVLP
jgi:hypothetical protein